VRKDRSVPSEAHYIARNYQKQYTRQRSQDWKRCIRRPNAKN